MQKLKVSNLPRWISEIHLKHFFSRFGTVIHASVALDQGTLRHLGYGYIIFAEDKFMQAALLQDGAVLDGATIKVEIAENEQASV